MSPTGKESLLSLVKPLSFARDAVVANARLVTPASAPCRAAATTDLKGLTMDCREAMMRCSVLPMTCSMSLEAIGSSPPQLAMMPASRYAKLALARRVA